jgi:membrane protease YdiL (CAAX protease family)
LWLELVLLFVGIPMIYIVELANPPKITVLGIGLAYCIAILFIDKSFSFKSIFRFSGFGNGFRKSILLFIAFLFISATAVYLIPGLELFNFPKQEPSIWLLVMIFYPLFSVIPQSIIYRSFFFHRYRNLFGNEQILFFAAAAVFAYAHLIYGHWISVFFTFAGGILFNGIYLKTRSLPLSALMHALYGNWVFTVGLGDFFYVEVT